MTTFSPILQRFLAAAPLCVITRGLLENLFAPAKLDQLFATHAVTQSTRELLFSTAVALFNQVVCAARPSVHAAYKQARHRGQIAVTVKALYDKLAHVETATSAALVRHTATEARAILQFLGDPPPALLPGYDVRVIDGNHLGGTDKRLGVLRDVSCAALPGVLVAVLDPQARLIEDVALSPDGHAQECTLVEPLLERARERQVWLADRHFCTSPILFALHARGAAFVFRQHAGHLRWRAVGERRRVGRAATGVAYEQTAVLTDPPTGAELTVRRVTLILDRPSRDGETEIHLLSTLPEDRAAAPVVADLYAKRWLVETAFRDLTVYLGCEVRTLGYPPAALLGFCLAVSSYNVLAVLKGAVRAAHGAAAEEQLSTYYLADEVGGTDRGLAIAVPDADWLVFRGATAAGLARLLRQILAAADLSYYGKNAARPKKTPDRRRTRTGDKHVATHRLLNPTHYPKKKAKRTE